MNIDVRQVVRNKSERLYRRVPGFVFTLLEKVIHQDEINDILTRFGHLRDIPFMTAVLDDLKIRRESYGLERISPDKPYIFACNHPLGGLDGFALAEAVAGHCGDVRLVVNDLLMNLDPIKGLFTPINKHGRQNSLYAKELNEVLESGMPVVYFPAGLCSRRIGGRVTDLPWKKTFIQKAIDSGRDVVPVYVDDENSKFFYTFANVRKRLGVKANLEMLLLPSELFKKRGKGHIRMYFGNPVPHELLKSERTPAKWAETIREQCYRLPRQNVERP